AVRPGITPKASSRTPTPAYSSGHRFYPDGETVPTDAEVSKIANSIKGFFPIKDLGEPAVFLGCALSRDYANGTITMSQTAYVHEILKKADIGSDMPGVDTPILPSWKGQDGEEDEMLDDEHLNRFLSVIGSMNWLAVKTRPDIRYTTTRLQHRSAKPTNADYDAMIHLGRYLKKHDNLGIMRRTPTGKTGSPPKEAFASSTIAAEWCALDQPAKDAKWLAKIASQLGLPRYQDPITIFTDNINTQLLLAKKGCKNSTRWLEIRWFFVKIAVARGHIDVKRADTKRNPADGFTKALDPIAFKRFLEMLGMKAIK
ncbi:hypothetical protein PENARI_c076G07733, partial [Penicillium arizonense]